MTKAVVFTLAAVVGALAGGAIAWVFRSPPWWDNAGDDDETINYVNPRWS